MAEPTTMLRTQRNVSRTQAWKRSTQKASAQLFAARRSTRPRTVRGGTRGHSGVSAPPVARGQTARLIAVKKSLFYSVRKSTHPQRRAPSVWIKVVGLLGNFVVQDAMTRVVEMFLEFVEAVLQIFSHLREEQLFVE